MRILYGVVGEGMGHATRSKVILDHVLGVAGLHEVEIVVSGRAHGFLTRAFPQLRVHEVAGLTLSYQDNRVRKWRTFRALMKSLPQFADNVDVLREVWDRFRPEVVISDFESLAYLFAREHALPILSIDNPQILNRCTIDVAIPKVHREAFALSKAIVKAKLPGCDHYLITSFFFPPLRKKWTSLYPPILRDAILAAKSGARRGDHVLVYQTSPTFRSLVPTLQKIPYEFRVYGLGRDEDLGNVQLKAFAEQGFVDDLASCRAVLAGGGFSLMGEAVYLGKPMLSVPVVGQFEQVLNALYLQALGYGEYHPMLSPDGIEAFLAHSETYAGNLEGFHQDGNALVFASVDALLAEIAEKGRLRPP